MSRHITRPYAAESAGGIEKTVGLRVSKEAEMEGLDVTEHGGNAYPDFTTASRGSLGAGGGMGGRMAFAHTYSGAVSNSEQVGAGS